MLNEKSSAWATSSLTVGGRDGAIPGDALIVVVFVRCRKRQQVLEAQRPSSYFMIKNQACCNIAVLRTVRQVASRKPKSYVVGGANSWGSRFHAAGWRQQTRQLSCSGMCQRDPGAQGQAGFRFVPGSSLRRKNIYKNMVGNLIVTWMPHLLFAQ